MRFQECIESLSVRRAPDVGRQWVPVSSWFECGRLSEMVPTWPPVADISTPEGQQPNIFGGQQCGTVNRRLKEASVTAEGVKPLATWMVDIRHHKWTGQGATVYSRGGPCTTGQQFWTPDAFRNTLPMKADECVRDMAGVTQVENQPRGCVDDWLHADDARKTGREAYMGAVAVV